MPTTSVAHDLKVLQEARRLSAGTAGMRNTLWFTWLRRPLGPALRRTVYLAVTAPRDRTSGLAWWDAVRGLPWVLAHRRTRLQTIEDRLAPLDATQRASTARRYV
jgi:hypothetical protein